MDIGQHVADNYEADIFCLAPGEGQLPISVFNKEGCCLPTLFPDGKCTFDDKDR